MFHRFISRLFGVPCLEFEVPTPRETYCLQSAPLPLLKSALLGDISLCAPPGLPSPHIYHHFSLSPHVEGSQSQFARAKTTPWGIPPSELQCTRLAFRILTTDVPKYTFSYRARAVDMLNTRFPIDCFSFFPIHTLLAPSRTTDSRTFTIRCFLPPSFNGDVSHSPSPTLLIRPLVVSEYICIYYLHSPRLAPTSFPCYPYLRHSILYPPSHPSRASYIHTYGSSLPPPRVPALLFLPLPHSSPPNRLVMTYPCAYRTVPHLGRLSIPPSSASSIPVKDPSASPSRVSPPLRTTMTPDESQSTSTPLLPIVSP
ncbi:hypothetical protein R3P38DRAFT_1196182 [Favolaschia claudopus]|uniref:Uncharacterized protein n=1 Tax=Favolaschia claudopus TaxID=2862362 RepID=A0AAW0DZV7_9AGAR